MSVSDPFIRRPIATTLLTIAVALAGGVAFKVLPVSPLPAIEYPTISVSCGLPGASPETMASSVATPLERQFGRIAGVTEMTSNSGLGSTNITMQFDLNRNVDAAARDVEAAINAARGQLPANLPTNPTYKKVNPADSPIVIIALTSDVLNRGQMYDVASTILQQKLSQVDGVGQVTVGGSSLPAVRVEVNPKILEKYDIGLDAVRIALNAANANTPKGQFINNHRTWDITANDQLSKADSYRGLIVAYRNGATVRVGDVAEVVDSVEDLRNAGYANGKPSVLLVINRQPGANIIETVDRIHALVPNLRASIPSTIHLDVALDQTTTIRASIADVEHTLVISVLLVILVVFVFLRNWRATIIPGVAVPVSIVGTFGIMYLLGYSLDNLSLMALTISTGFVVDDAIVVVENVSRYLEQGMSPIAAARKGAGEIGFTVVSISISLIAVFIPLLLMGGLVGRLFREFAVTLSVAVLVSMVVSLTTTPMMCAYLLKPHRKDEKHNRIYQLTEHGFTSLLWFYEWTLTRVLRHPLFTLIILFLTIGLNYYLIRIVPGGFFPQQDNGRISGNVQADQDTSFQSMQKKLEALIAIVKTDPAVATVIGFTSGTNGARVFVTLKPLAERGGVTADMIVVRLRPKLAKVPGATLYLQPQQDLRVGGRQANAAYQYSMQSDNLEDLNHWSPLILAKLRKVPILSDVNIDQQNKGLQAVLTYDRDTAARFGISSKQIDDTLNNAFGQRQVSTIYTSLNQYRVIMEAAPEYWQSPDSLKDFYVPAPDGKHIPLNVFTRYTASTASLAINHQGQFPASTISFNLDPGYALGDAVTAVDQAVRELGVPETVRGKFAGTAQAYQAAIDSEPLLVLAAVVCVYIILGMLYESYIHPITIISTLPSAGVGAMLALLIFRVDLNLIAIIGIILLIGIVKKNAIMMIDFALNAERHEGKGSYDAIFEACILRFRPILMTTMAAMLGAVPLAFGTGTGSELRRPLGITIIGGLLVSQVLTLYTTPVVYLYLDRFSHWIRELRGIPAPKPVPAPAIPA